MRGAIWSVWLAGFACLACLTPAAVLRGTSAADVTIGGPGSPVISDGVTDCTSAFQAAVNSAGPGDLTIAAGTYRTSAAIRFPASVFPRFSSGATILADQDGIVLDGQREGEWSVRVRRSTRAWHIGTDPDSVGVLVRNNRQCQGRINLAADFRTNVVVRGEAGGCTDNILSLGNVSEGRIGVLVEGVNYPSGFANQNILMGGQVRLSSWAAAYSAGTVGVDLRQNGWTLIGVNLQGNVVETALALRKAAWTVALNNRYEAVKPGGLYNDADSHKNTLAFGYGLFKPLLRDEGKETVVLSTRGFRSNHDAGTVYGFGGAYESRALSGTGDKAFRALNTSGVETAHLRSDGEWRAKKYTVAP